MTLPDPVNSDDGHDAQDEREQNLFSVFVRLADSLKASHDVVDTMDFLVESATEFSSATEAGILLSDGRGKLHVVASTSERATDVEEAQLGADAGPCLVAYETGESVEVPDIAAEAKRWPAFSAIARARGFRAAHATPLRLRNHGLGGINLFAPHLGGLSDRDTALIQAMAEIATISIVNTQIAETTSTVTEQLQRALDSRITIEQSKGILAERHDIGMDAAFNLIRHHARSNGLKLALVAELIVQRRLQV